MDWWPNREASLHNDLGHVTTTDAPSCNLQVNTCKLQSKQPTCITCCIKCSSATLCWIRITWILAHAFKTIGPQSFHGFMDLLRDTPKSKWCYSRGERASKIHHEFDLELYSTDPINSRSQWSNGDAGSKNITFFFLVIWWDMAGSKNIPFFFLVPWWDMVNQMMHKIKLTNPIHPNLI